MKSPIAGHTIRRGRGFACVAILLAGCGSGEGFPRHQVSGRVTYQGRDVEYGTIVFEPTLSVGELAPTCFARIENGSFTTPRDESPTTGEYNVRVRGFDAEKMRTIQDSSGEGAVIETPPLFPEYVLQVQIPPPTDRLDIQVPDEPVQ